MHLEQQIAFSSALIDAGVPEREADEITDSVAVDPPGEVYAANIASISNWTREPTTLMLHALICASAAE